MYIQKGTICIIRMCTNRYVRLPLCWKVFWRIQLFVSNTGPLVSIQRSLSNHLLVVGWRLPSSCGVNHCFARNRVKSPI